jgi:hypothetical protein
MPFRLATLKLFGQSLSGNKKIAPKHNASKQFLVPVTGLEPVRHRWRWILRVKDQQEVSGIRWS